MATQLPVPLELELPEGWTSAPPDEVDAPGAAFVALHLPSADGFTANITVSGSMRSGDDVLEETADESLERLGSATAGAAELRQRQGLGSADAPGLMQLVDLTTTIDNQPLKLIQFQVYLLLRDVSDPEKQVVVEVMLTCKESQFDTVLPDFQTFVSNISPA
ncbi:MULTISPECIES: hypothetical protein [Prauserella salsuginis group]|uniref:Lipoprotein LpqN n=2 Tax=Prauserella salsuginis group TaxID=2893672 RepID=A0A839XL80_9PSEU|nr:MULTISPECIES: hypothetical protein [Prauserella salsuginis group]MBB3663501.1 hypothetical protein [Prauserella sediminis]MCR3720679.1 hypothetical protein [Prauserella flava]MCR3735240.1 hypothetical protein [Prauserella salsuginis]